LGALALALAGCGASPEAEYVGTVDTPVTTLSAPILAYPQLDTEITLTETEEDFDPEDEDAEVDESIGNSLGDTDTSAPAVNTDTTWYQVVEVPVKVGQQVSAGDVLAQLDGRAWELAGSAGQAQADEAKAQVSVLAQTIKDLDEKRDDIAEGRDQIADAKKQIKKAEKTLKKGKKDLAKSEKALAKQQTTLAKNEKTLKSQKKQLVAALKVLPPGPQRTATEQALAKVNAGLKKIATGKQQLKAAQTKLKAAKKKLTAAEKKLKKSKRTVKSNTEKLDQAEAKLDDALVQLAQAKTLASKAADTLSVAPELWASQRAQLTITASQAGTVMTLPQPGDVLAAGATVATLRPDQDAQIRVWLPPSQVPEVAALSCITTDWGQTATGTVQSVAPQAEFPPNTLATEEIHLTRAVEVVVASADALPAGTPVKLVFTSAANCGQKE
jgi:multidrug resistance efflux pump